MKIIIALTLAFTSLSTFAADDSHQKYKGQYKYQNEIDYYSQREGIDPQLVNAVIMAESGYNENALSHKGAIGLMQVLPSTGARFGHYQLTSPVDNIDAGVTYLGYLMKLFNGKTELAIAAYNAGEGAVIRHGYQIPEYSETQQYVKQVLKNYNDLNSKPVYINDKPKNHLSSLPANDLERVIHIFIGG